MVPSQNAQSETSMSIFAVFVSPGFRSTFAKPMICFAGSPLPFGYTTYAWTISEPSRLPVLVTSTESETLPFASAFFALAFAFAYLNVV